MNSAWRFVVGDDLVARLFDVQEGFVARDDLGHLRFDAGEVGFGERDLAVDVVEEAVVGGGAVAELGLGEELEDGRGHDVRGGVADDLERGGVVLLEQLERDVFGERRGEVDDAGLACGRVGGVHRLFAGFESRPRWWWPRRASSGLMRATTTAAARRGEMLLAISSGVVPAGTSRTEPSGSWILIGLLTQTRIVHSGIWRRPFDTMAEVPGVVAGQEMFPGDDLVQARRQRDRTHAGPRGPHRGPVDQVSAVQQAALQGRAGSQPAGLPELRLALQVRRAGAD